MDPITEFWRDPAMPQAQSRRACASRACYRPHSHATFSIGAVDRGQSHFTGAGAGLTVLHAGSVVFVPADRIHACNPAPGSAWSYQMLHLDAAWLQAVREEYGAGAESDGAREPVRIVNAPAVYASFCRLNALLFSAVDVQHKCAALIEFIGDCDSAQGLRMPMPHPSGAGERIAPVLELLRRDPAAHAALAPLAALAGMSRYQLIRAFRAATGLTPHAWQLNQRINLARERILAGAGIADLAQELGFADQAHFQRMFKGHAGVTPGRFRA